VTIDEPTPVPPTIIEPITEDLWYKRPVKISTIAISNTLVNTTADVLNSWLTDPLVKSKMANVKLFRPMFKVRLSMASNPQIYGNLMVVNSPLDSSTAVGYVTGSNMDHVLLSPCGVNEAEMTIPWTYPHDYYTYDGTANIVRNQLGDSTVNETLPYPFITRFIQSTPFNTTSATFPGTNLVMTAWCESLDIAQPYAQQSGKKPKSTPKDEYSKPVLSKTATNIAGELDSLSSIPFIGGAAKATSMALRMGAGIASVFGFSRPALIDDPTLVINPKYGDTYSSTRGRYCTRIVEDFKQELALSGFKAGPSDSVDELAFDNLVDCWTLVTTGTIVATTPANFLQIPVLPGVLNSTSNATWWNVSRLSATALMFNYWRGDLTYKIRIDSTIFHSGQLLVMWNPLPGTTMAESTNRNKSVIIDLNGSKELYITVTYGNTIPFAKTITWTSGDGRVVATSGAPTYTNGELQFTIYAPVGALATTSPIQYTIWVKGEPGFDFAVVSDYADRAVHWNSTATLPVVPYVSGDTAMLRGNTATAGLLSGAYEPQSGSAPIAETLKYTLGSKTEGSDADAACYGQSFRSLRPYLKKNMPYYRWTTASAVRVAVDVTNILQPQRLENGVTPYVENNMLGAIMTAFCGYSGSLRYAVSPSTLNDEATVAIRRRVQNPPSSATKFPCINSVTTENIWNNLRQEMISYTHGVVHFGPAAEISFELPYSFRQNFMPVFKRATASANGPTTPLAREALTATLVYQLPGQTVSLDTSIGEDFNLFIRGPMHPVAFRTNTTRNTQITPKAYP